MGVVGLRKKALKARGNALGRLAISWGAWHEILTWRMSSKSRAASCFISDTFDVNRRMVVCPKDGICLKLQNSGEFKP